MKREGARCELVVGSWVRLRNLHELAFFVKSIVQKIFVVRKSSFSKVALNQVFNVVIC